MSRIKSEAAEEFIEAMGLFCQADGLSRTGGRILAMLILFDGPIGFDEIADYLQISRSGVSTNTRELERLKLIHRVARAGDRQHYFEIAERAYSQLLEDRMARLAHAEAAVRRAQTRLPMDWASAQRRLSVLGMLYRTSIDKTHEVIDLMAEYHDEDENGPRRATAAGGRP